MAAAMTSCVSYEAEDFTGHTPSPEKQVIARVLPTTGSILT